MHLRKGFTLAEILVAMLILGIVMASSFEVIKLGYRASSISRNSVLLAFLAQSKLEEISYQGGMTEESAGTFSPPYENFQWEARIQKVKAVPDLLQITVEISGNVESLEKKQNFLLTSYLLKSEKT